MIIYTEFYRILEEYVFGTITQGSYQELVAILCSTVASIAVIALPVMVIAKAFASLFKW